MYPQKMPCTPKIQPLGVHVPSNKFVSGHAAPWGAHWPSGRASDTGASGRRFDTAFTVLCPRADTDTPRKVLVTLVVMDVTLSLSSMTSQNLNQRTNGPVNAHLVSWPSKAQNIQNLENIW